jgi:hypothetical protein
MTKKTVPAFYGKYDRARDQAASGEPQSDRKYRTIK